MQQEDTPPYVEGVMAIVRQQEWVLNSIAMGVNATSMRIKDRDERELVNGEAHNHRYNTRNDCIPTHEHVQLGFK